MVTFGYVRVSSADQADNFSFQVQKETLQKCGVKENNIVYEVGSAAGEFTDRPELNSLLQLLKAEDTIWVARMDRFSRNMVSFIQAHEDLQKRGISLRAADLPFNKDENSSNKLILHIMSAFAEFEFSVRKERQREGIEAAKKAGKYKGRKSVITPKLIEYVKRYLNKKLSVTEIARLTGHSRSPIYRLMKNELGYISNKLIQPNDKIDP